ncbi:hypothetical protein [Bacillus sp. KH172YL63]|uniref:hypothetical protein n=1 Tax=Bacillus sp. KH172YL63 TaxID=2709784 RepID=UPI0013E455D5|nr:hypothetical protein [Bacillus sp. KH172YL63]BCB04017.1 hypothetical protein KH172YL63_21500 [Bacillus sp. KH172YL63]
MKSFHKCIVLLVTVFFIFLLFDFVKYDDWIWKENLLQAFFFTFFYSLLVWLMGLLKKKE